MSACVGRDGTHIEEILLKHMKGSHIRSQTGQTTCSVQAEESFYMLPLLSYSRS